MRVSSKEEADKLADMFDECHIERTGTQMWLVVDKVGRKEKGMWGGFFDRNVKPKPSFFEVAGDSLFKEEKKKKVSV